MAGSGWIWIHMVPELLPGSRSGTLNIQSWIRNKSFRIRNTENIYSTVYNGKWTSSKHFVFHLSKKKPKPTQKIGSGSSSNCKSAPAQAKKPRLRPAPAPQHCLQYNLRAFLRILILIFRIQIVSQSEPGLTKKVQSGSGQKEPDLAKRTRIRNTA